MTTDEKISQNRDEFNDARQDLRDTLSEVSAKAEELESKLRPDRLIENSPIGAAWTAGALGFVLGSRAHPSVLGPVMIFALLGFALSKKFSEDGKRSNGREAASTQ
ncbi:MAG: hypothetical protein IVW54_09680 [Candidatus Binataceae bacterium]|nr:hypothetical protein [Candidatus Binataceae bacterium]